MLLFYVAFEMVWLCINFSLTVCQWCKPCVPWIGIIANIDTKISFNLVLLSEIDVVTVIAIVLQPFDAVNISNLSSIDIKNLSLFLSISWENGSFREKTFYFIIRLNIQIEAYLVNKISCSCSRFGSSFSCHICAHTHNEMDAAWWNKKQKQSFRCNKN